MDDTIFFHEDFYREIELIPQPNYFKTYRDINENITPNGIQQGYFTIRQRKEPTIKIENIKIKIDDITNILQPYILKYFHSVTTGYGNVTLPKKDKIAL